MLDNVYIKDQESNGRNLEVVGARSFHWILETVNEIPQLIDCTKKQNGMKNKLKFG